MLKVLPGPVLQFWIVLAEPLGSGTGSIRCARFPSWRRPIFFEVGFGWIFAVPAVSIAFRRL